MKSNQQLFEEREKEEYISEKEEHIYKRMDEIDLSIEGYNCETNRLKHRLGEIDEIVCELENEFSDLQYELDKNVGEDDEIDD